MFAVILITVRQVLRDCLLASEHTLSPAGIRTALFVKLQSSAEARVYIMMMLMVVIMLK